MTSGGECRGNGASARAYNAVSRGKTGGVKSDPRKTARPGIGSHYLALAPVFVDER